MFAIEISKFSRLFHLPCGARCDPDGGGNFGGETAINVWRFVDAAGAYGSFLKAPLIENGGNIDATGREASAHGN